jgi:hypothetical protein
VDAPYTPDCSWSDCGQPPGIELLWAPGTKAVLGPLVRPIPAVTSLGLYCVAHGAIVSSSTWMQRGGDVWFLPLQCAFTEFRLN